MIKKRIEQLREKFKYLNIQGYVVPKNDEFFSEYSYPNRLKSISNFSGSAGLAIILKDKNLLFVDGRYTLQAHIECGKSFKIFENLILDNFDENVNERLMYSLFNLVDQDNKFVIINSLIPINKINFKLDDLNSRVKNCLFAKIEKPDDELVFAILLKNFSDRQITIEKRLIEYIIKHIDRSYGKIYEFIYKIDEISLKKKKSIDFKIIKEALKV